MSAQDPDTNMSFMMTLQMTKGPRWKKKEVSRLNAELKLLGGATIFSIVCWLDSISAQNTNPSDTITMYGTEIMEQNNKHKGKW